MKYRIKYLNTLPDIVKPFRREVEADSPLQAVKKTLEQLESKRFNRLFTRCQTPGEGLQRSTGGRITAHVYPVKHTWPNGNPYRIESITFERTIHWR